MIVKQFNCIIACHTTQELDRIVAFLDRHGMAYTTEEAGSSYVIKAWALSPLQLMLLQQFNT